jgi:hypothetical protein
MTGPKILVTTVVVVAALLSLTAPAGAGGGAGLTAPCQVKNSGSGAVALKGAIAVEVQDATTQGPTTVDYTLRLERSGVTKFLRFSLDAIVFAASNEEVVCFLLDDPAFTEVVQTEFSLGARSLKITENSLRNAEAKGPHQNIPGTPRGSTLADITIYAVQ